MTEGLNFLIFYCMAEPPYVMPLYCACILRRLYAQGKGVSMWPQRWCLLWLLRDKWHSFMFTWLVRSLSEPAGGLYLGLCGGRGQSRCCCRGNGAVHQVQLHHPPSLVPFYLPTAYAVLVVSPSWKAKWVLLTVDDASIYTHLRVLCIFSILYIVTYHLCPQRVCFQGVLFWLVLPPFLLRWSPPWAHPPVKAPETGSDIHVHKQTHTGVNHNM